MGLDLVEVSPNSNPPVCRILDYGKYKYELAKKDKLSKKKQHTMQMKEMRYRPKIDEHDFLFKTKHVREFIEDGSKVKAFVMFRGREMAHTEYGRKVLDRLAKELEDIAIIDAYPKQEGRKMIMVLSPNAEVLKLRKLQKDAQVKTEKKFKKDIDDFSDDNEDTEDTNDEDILIENDTDLEVDEEIATDNNIVADDIVKDDRN